MSGFFGTGGSGSGSSTNANGSSSGSGTGGGGGGGWGSFLKQGLSSIESKLDMVLDMQVPIPGGASATLTSYSPHATVLPSSFTSGAKEYNTNTTTTTSSSSPKISTSSRVDLATGRDSEDTSDSVDGQSHAKRASTVSTKSSINSVRASVDDSTGKDAAKVEQTPVTVDPFTGMITTAPGIARMATPPISGASIASAATSTMNAAAAAAAANRERLEQRMRGIFKKPSTSTTAETAPTTPTPSTTAASSPVHSPLLSGAKQREENEKPEAEVDSEANRQPTENLAKDLGSVKTDESTQSVDQDTENWTTSDTTDGVADESKIETENDQPESKDTKEVSLVAADVDLDDSKTPVSESISLGKFKDDDEDDMDLDKLKEDTMAHTEVTKEDTGGSEKVDLVQSQETEKADDENERKLEDTPARSSIESESTFSPAIPVTDSSDTPKTSTEADTSDSQEESPSTLMEPIKIVAAVIPPSSSSNAQKSVLEQREEQLFKAMQEQSSLLERLRDLEDAKASEDALRVNKIAGLEKIIESQKKELEVARASNLTSQPKSIQKTLEEQRALLEEKDEQIRGLLVEGEILSKKEFKNLTSIKTLRTKNIEQEKNQMDLQKKFDKLSADLAETQGRVSRLLDDNKQLSDSLRSTHDTNQRQAKQISKLESEVSQLREDKSGLQLGLDRAWQELSEARKASAELSNQTHAAALDREVKLNEELLQQVTTLKKQHESVEQSLRQDIQDLRVSLSNREELAGETEDHLRMEIKSLQYRLEQTDNDSFELQEALDEARRPLLRQMEQIQNQHAIASRNWDKIEAQLTRRVTEAEEDVNKAQDRERAVRDRFDEVKSQNSTLEARLETLRIADTQLRSEVSASKRIIVEKEEAARQAQAELSRERVNRERAVEEAKADVERKWRLLQQAETEKHKAQLHQLSSTSQRGATLPVPNATEDEVVMLSAVPPPRRPSSSSTTTTSAQQTPLMGTSFESTSLTSPTNLDGMSPSLSRTSSSHTMSGMAAGVSTGSSALGLSGLGGSHSTGPAVAIERLNTMVRQLEGQVTFLAEQVRTTNKNKDDLSDELVKVTMELEELQQVASRVPGLEQELSLLQQRHKAALEMLGEKTEEVQELQQDISDVKEAYRDQINELLSQLEKSRTR
ncbi:hypothetical protein BGZ83_008430 [Gryganskiella cystojenkinii]|nr:hypothetical protein BGZ83_008430 [Gryganskiella cystojenkinii]